MDRPSENPPLAIIGMACRMPGAENLDAFWQLLRSGGSGIGEIPPERLDRELYFHPEKGRLNKTYSTLGGLVAPRPLDRSLCPLTDRQIAGADIAHLTLCEVAAAACRHAGLDPFDLPLRNTGVYVGHTAASPLAAQVAYRSNVAEMAHLLRQVEPLAGLPAGEREDLIRELIAAVRGEAWGAQTGSRLELSSLGAAKLISRGFGLTGPFLVVDAACASSLQALSIAAAALQQGRIDMAVVGGASYCKSDTLVLFSHAQSLSAKGSRPFDADADGLILAEGYVSVILKTVARATADGDRILAVIRGIGMSTDGRGKSLWAPRKEGQMLAIRRAYEPDLDVAQLQYLEAHATSTQIGDATELQALAESLSGRLPAGQKIPIGSVKANVGHTLEAAGLSGLVKTVLAMQHQIVPPAVNCRRLNPELDWSRAPFFVPTSELAWPAPAAGQPRRAAVNSFGIGGLNVHIVLDEFAVETARSTHVVAPAAPRRGDAVAIVGMGCLLPGARSVAAFWDLLARGADALGVLPEGRWDPSAGTDSRTGRSFAEKLPRGGFITDYAYDWRRHVVPPKQVEQANPLQFMLLDATEEALRDAGYDQNQKPLDRQRVGVVVGAMFGDEFSQQLNMALRMPQFQRTLGELLRARGVPAGEIDTIAARFEKLLLKRMPALVDETGSFTSSTLASRITKSFDFFGGGLALDAGEASGLAALAAGVDFLQNGSCDMVVCAAGDRNMGLVVYEAEALRGRLATGQTHSRFSARADGSLPGEGAGVLLLKRLADAQRDGDRIRGIIRGVGAAAGEDLYQANRLAMRRALRDAHVESHQVAALELCGAETGSAESRQAAAVVETYCTGDRRQPLLLGSLAGQIGNTRAASGLAGVVKSTLAMQHGELPAEIGFDQAATWVAEKPAELQVASRPLALGAAGTAEKLVTAVAASTDDCLAYHVILERGTEVPHATPNPTVPVSLADRHENRPEWQIFRLTAGSQSDLAARAGAAVATAEALWSTPGAKSFPADAAWRMALVADSAAALATKLRLAADQLPLAGSRGALEEQGISYQGGPRRTGQVAFVFPGQGSQYAGMLGDLVRQNSAAGDAVREVDAALALMGYPGFDEISADADQLLGADVLRTQLAMLLADLIVFRTLTSLGIQPAIVTGHSYGEFAALVAAGAWSLEQAIGATAARCQSIDRGCPPLATQMLSVAAPADAVRPLVAGRSDVYLSHRNAPDQTVVAGEAAAVQALASQLRSAGFESRPLNVPRAFHTPLMAGAQAHFAAALEKTWLTPPQIPLLSSVSLRLAQDPAEIRANLVAQLTEPVDYVALVEGLARSGASVLIEAGPQQVLTRLNRRILGDTAVAVASDHPKRSSEQQLCRLLAQLEVAGVSRSSAPATRLLATPAARPMSPSAAPASSDPLATTFVNLDATTRRKAKLRDQGTPAAPTRPAENRPAAPAPAAAAAPAIAPQTANGTPASAEPALSGTNGQPGSSLVRRKQNAPPISELETFLVQFVIDQTGYPPELVGLDADLEADLGIDSIKKAQLFGELREYFDVTPSDDLRLDQFPTLRHVLDFLRGAPGKADWLDDAPPAGGAPVAPPAPVAASRTATPEPAPSQTNTSQTNTSQTNTSQFNPSQFNTAQYNAAQFGGSHLDTSPTGNGPTASATLAPAPAWTASTPELPPDGRPQRAKIVVRAKASAPRIDELEQFLVQFVVEQTGYPPEIVKLEADLEADLGIDSIKKAQLFGELGQFFDVSAPENLRLDDFPTLGHVLQLLKSAMDEAQAAAAAPVAAPLAAPATPPAAPTPAPVAVAAQTAAQASVAPAAPLDLRPLEARPALESADEPAPADDRMPELAGMTYAAARQYGEAQRQSIRQQLKQRAEKASKESVRAAWPEGRPAPAEELFNPAELEALRGLAEGAQVSLANLIAWQLGGTAAGRRPENGAPIARDGEPQPAAATPTQRTQRLVLRMLAAPLNAQDAGAAFVPAGAAMVLGDGAVAGAIAARLKSQGVPVELISSSGSWPQVRQQFENFWSRQPVRHVFLATSHDPEARLVAGEAAWQRRYERGVLTPLLLCQEWLARLEEAKLCDGATLLAATALGGDFGFATAPATVEGGAAAGLVKSLFIESLYEKWTGLRFKVVDFPGNVPAADAVAAIFQELAAREKDVEIGFRDGRRHVVRGVEQPAQAQTAAAQPAAALPRGTWVVTGGARGITAICAQALARRYNLRLHLVGRSPYPEIDPSWRGLSATGIEELRRSVIRRAHAAGQPPLDEWSKVEKAIEIDRTLRACAAAGIAATYHSCDVSCWDDLERVLEEIREIDGPIEGVLHGAGIVRDASFRRKKPAHVRQTFEAKACSAAALIELTRQDPLRHFVAFSSVSGRFGMTGQADYASANELQCKLIDGLRRQRPECRSVGIHWHAWDETGLASRPELAATFASLDIQFMPPAEGVEHLIRELECGVPESEIVFTSIETCRKQYPLTCLAEASEFEPAVSAPGAPAAPVAVAAPAAAAAPLTAAVPASRPLSDTAPMLSKVVDEQPGTRLVAEMHLDPARDAFLAEHLLGGKPLLPFVIGVESLAQAAQLFAGGHAAIIENVQVHNGLSVSDPAGLRALVEMRMLSPGKCRGRITREFRDREGRLVDPERECISAEIQCAAALAPLAPPAAGQPPLGWFPMMYPDDAPIYHGPKLRTLKQLAVQYDGAFGKIVAPAPEELGASRGKSGWILPAAALDGCLMLCSTFAYFQFAGRFEIPTALARLQVGRAARPGESCLVRMYFKGQDARSARYDFQLSGDNGDCLLLVEGYQTSVFGGPMK